MIVEKKFSFVSRQQEEKNYVPARRSQLLRCPHDLVAQPPATMNVCWHMIIDQRRHSHGALITTILTENSQGHIHSKYNNPGHLQSAPQTDHSPTSSTTRSPAS